MSKAPKTISVYDYVNYRHFLKDKYAELKKKRINLSYRSFNKIAGLRSPGYLKMIMEGERNLGEEGIRMLAKGFHLNEPERKYFENLVRFNQAETLEEKDRFFRELTETKRFLAAKPLTAAQLRLFTHWYYVAILELVRVSSEIRKDAKWIAQSLNPQIGLVAVKRAVRELTELGLLQKNGDGGLERKEAMITTEDDVKSLAVARFHVEMGNLAIRAAMKEPARDREFSALTIVTSEESFLKAKQKIRLFRENLHSMLEQEDDGPKTVVAQINTQLFKLNKRG